MRPGDQLIKGFDNLNNDCPVRRRRLRPCLGELTEIVDALLKEDDTRVWLRQRILIKASERTGTMSINQQLVACDALIRHGPTEGQWIRLQALGQQIGSTIILIGRRSAAVRDGIPKGDDEVRAGRLDPNRR